MAWMNWTGFILIVQCTSYSCSNIFFVIAGNCNCLKITKFILVKDHLFVGNQSIISKKIYNLLKGRGVLYGIQGKEVLSLMTDNIYTPWAYFFKFPLHSSYSLHHCRRTFLLLFAYDLSKLPIISNESFWVSIPSLGTWNAIDSCPIIAHQPCLRGRIMRPAANSAGPRKFDILR